ncbi:MAG: exodeoxyribonuclease VII large subunit [Patescibacteria group bacterium]
MDTERILSVSEFNQLVSDYLAQGLGIVTVQGEVSGFRVARERLVYFELKDEHARCLCFALRWELDQPLEDGMEIKVTGMPKIFQSSGGFHLRVQAVELVGAGALQKAYEILKKKLEGEGLFEERWKVPLPRFSEHIGIITSPTAAAYTDILRRLQERWGGLTITLAPVAVQGAMAVKEIVGAVKYLNETYPVDVIILTRGGGSMEDLQAFNSEPVVRAVFASKIPVVVGVGHERDVTLADFVADARASTPTNAAELVIPHRREIMRELAGMEAKVTAAFERELQNCAYQVSHLLTRAWHAIEFRMQEVQGLCMRYPRILSHIVHIHQRYDDRLVQLSHRLRALSPHETLKRGYSITRIKGMILREATGAREGDIMETELAKGVISSKVM